MFKNFSKFKKRLFKNLKRKISSLQPPTLEQRINTNQKIRRFFMLLGFGSIGLVIYSHTINSRLELIYKDTKENSEIINFLRDLKNPKYPITAYLPFRFMQVIYGNRFDNREFVEYIREIVYDQNGENFALDWGSVHALHEEKVSEKTPIVILLPGLTGGSESQYMKAQMNQLRKDGFRPVVFNPKGTGIPQKSLNFFDFTKVTDDVDHVVDHIRNKFQGAHVYLIGFSLGASYGMQYLSQDRAKEKI